MNSNAHISCMVCNTQSVLYRTKDNANYYACKNCGLIFQHPLPSLEDMIIYANREYTDGAYLDYLRAKELKYTTFRRRLSIIEKNTQGKRLLDVGCSSGYFIDVALEAGFDPYGVEFSKVAIAAASKEAKPRITQGDVNSLDSTQEKSYDLVSAYDILEHTLNPIAFLLQLKKVLKPGGFVIITTPNTAHFLRKLMGSRWPMLQPFQHTFLFSPKSLQLALQKADYHDIKVTTAYKVLTPDYLAEQLRIHNPLIAKAYRIGSKILPRKIRQMPLQLNIGEIMAVAFADAE